MMKLIAVSLFSLFSSQVLAADQEEQVNIAVSRSGNHVTIECRPSDAAQAPTGQEWKALCNEMADPHVRKMAADGTIAQRAGAVFTQAEIEAAADKLTKEIPVLSPQP